MTTQSHLIDEADRLHITVVDDEKIIQCGVLTWLRTEQRGERVCEVWTVQSLGENLGLSHFCVKNYGGEPDMGAHGYVNNAFTGWRVVSGGPFTTAGGWNNREDAIRAATPWVINHYRQQVKELRQKAYRAERALAGITDLLQ